MTNKELKIIEHINNLSGDYKCFNERLTFEEALALDRLLKVLQEYETIGTIKEFKALKEKEKSLKREIRHGDYFCPKCGSLVEYVGYCHACGQNVYWLEEIKCVG